MCFGIARVARKTRERVDELLRVRRNVNTEIPIEFANDFLPFIPTPKAVKDLPEIFIQFLDCESLRPSAFAA